jgi:hypothetical protein
LVAHVTFQLLKAGLDRSRPSEQADAHFEKKPTGTVVPVQSWRKGDPLGAVASEMGAKRTVAGAKRIWEQFSRRRQSSLAAASIEVTPVRSERKAGLC